MGLQVQSGQAMDLGSQFWQIVDRKNQELTEFDHDLFPYILPGAFVYFVDLDLDPQFCENVQSQTEVDDLFSSALPDNGSTAEAEKRLRLYIMAALLHALRYDTDEQNRYLNRLRDKLSSIRIAAAGSENGKLTVDVLKSGGILD